MIEKQRFHFLKCLSFRMIRLLFLALVFMICFTILINYIDQAKPQIKHPSYKENFMKRNQLFYEKYNLHDFQETLKNDNLEQRLNELFKIRESILNELVYLENRRQKQQEEITNYAIKLDEVKSQIVHKQNELTRIHLSLEQAEYSRKEVVLKNRPFISNPLKIIDDNLFQVNLTKNSIQTNLSNSLLIKRCSMHHCFDYSKCPLTKKLSIYLDRRFIDQLNEDDEFIKLFKTNFIKYCDMNFNLIDELASSCLIVLPIFNENQINLISNDLKNRTNALVINFDLKDDQSKDLQFKNFKSKNIQSRNIQSKDLELKDLQSKDDQSKEEQSKDDQSKYTQSIDNSINKLNRSVENSLHLAMIVQNDFDEHTFRERFDIILPSIEYIRRIFKLNQQITSTVKRYLHCPAKRKYFVSCVHNLKNDQKTNLQLAPILNGIFNNNLNKFDLFYLNFNYSTDNFLDEHLIEIYSQSTFTLILPDDDLSKISSELVHRKLATILSTNSIPIILGDYQIQLPFNEVIDWNLALIKLPLARVSELHLILKSFNDNDLIRMRRNGKLFYERYLSRIDYLIASLFSILKSKRLQLPLNSIKDDNSNSIYNKNERPMHFYEINTDQLENANDIEENLGPINEPAFSSITYQRNFSLILTETYNLWNHEYLNPFFMFPHSPYDPLLPSEAKFKGSSYGFRPIKNGLGGSGKEFSENIGGNYQREQFTIVMLTFERESILMDSLQRLKGLPYLNKIVIIWNSKRLPDNEIKWPDLGVEIVVVKAEKNSLNNRFKPYDVIETEAILSMDDDVHLRHDEIVFAFRVWRESRERIVGFPGRYHAWHQNEWLYSSNYSCELSMVLTGAAFFHKYYSYFYTNLMDSLIRDKVDEYMNCEDIAMNFLVSHLTRKPPLKVTSRWTFRCPACPMSLSEDDSHFEERHRCINYFISLYGYNPLLNTQFRADSVLFKTRIPVNKQKCFKLI